MLHASRRPYEVPVFHAIFGKCTVLCQFTGKSGRLTLDKMSSMIKVAAGLRIRCAGEGESVRDIESSVVYTGFTHRPSFAKMEYIPVNSSRVAPQPPRIIDNPAYSGLCRLFLNHTALA